MLPCGSAPSQTWDLNTSFFAGTPNASTGVLLPEHKDTPGLDYGWTFGAEGPGAGPSMVAIYEIGSRFHGECTGHLNCQFVLKGGQFVTYQGHCVAARPYAAPAPPPPAPPPPPPFAANPCTSTVCFSWTQGSHMVLQQAPAKSAVYGTVVGPSTAKISVTVTPAGVDAVAYTTPATVTVTAGGNSTWKAFLKPTPAGGNYTINAKCTSGCSGEAQIADVTFGAYLSCFCGKKCACRQADSPGSTLGARAMCALHVCRGRLVLQRPEQHGSTGSSHILSKQKSRSRAVGQGA